jgi:hypothetical protein
MTPLGLANAAMSIIACATIVYLLLAFSDTFRGVERAGWAMIATSCFLSIFKQLGLEHVVAPFNPWYQSLWRIGLILMSGGLGYRLRKHHLGNELQSRILLAHFAEDDSRQG